MINYDIGILSFWDVPNYGTFAQEYALQKVIQKLFPDRDVKQIAHLDSKHYDYYYNPQQFYKHFPIYTKTFWREFLNRYDRYNSEINQKCELFSSSYNTIPHTHNITLKNVNEFHFNKIILGSDIIWDFSQDLFNSDSFLFGLNFLADKVSSYAASFGVASKQMNIPSYVISAVKNLEYISVRDDNSSEIISHICGHRPELVLDPVWLWDFQSDENVIIPNYDNYILVYGQDFSEEFISNLIQYKKANNLKIVALDCNNDNYTWCDLLIKQSKLSPMEWIGYFKHSNAVVTSTFHGLTFGLIFNKRIAFYKTDFIMAKANGLINSVGLDAIFADKNNVESMLEYNWDYSSINQYFYNEKTKSVDFLKKVCS